VADGSATIPIHTNNNQFIYIYIKHNIKISHFIQKKINLRVNSNGHFKKRWSQNQQTKKIHILTNNNVSQIIYNPTFYIKQHRVNYIGHLKTGDPHYSADPGCPAARDCPAARAADPRGCAGGRVV
jgi:hypothetical protein